MSSFLMFEAFHHFIHASNDQNQIETDRTDIFLSRLDYKIKNYYYINSMHHASKGKGK